MALDKDDEDNGPPNAIQAVQ
jgi:hypothetical protein